MTNGHDSANSLTLKTPLAQKKRKLRRQKKTKAATPISPKSRIDRERIERRKKMREIDRRIENIRNKKEAQADACRIDTEVLAIEGVARLLRCSIAHVRGLSINELPRATGFGKRNLYLRTAVIELVRRSQNQVELNSGSLNELLYFEADNVRRRSP